MKLSIMEYEINMCEKYTCSHCKSCNTYIQHSCHEETEKTVCLQYINLKIFYKFEKFGKRCICKDCIIKSTCSIPCEQYLHMLNKYYKIERTEYFERTSFTLQERMSFTNNPVNLYIYKGD